MKGLQQVFAEINELEQAGLIENYALGGALAALFYTEVSRTYDVDIFALLDVPTGSLVSLEKIYTWAKEKGHDYKDEHLLIFNVPVQILVAAPGLQADAILSANKLSYEGVEIKVMKPEFLIALYLSAGGAKRKERAIALLELKTLDKKLLQELLTKYNLPTNLLPL